MAKIHYGVKPDIFKYAVFFLPRMLLPPPAGRWSGPQRHHSSVGCSHDIAHALQTLTDLDDRATVLSIDGIGAFDLISRGSMLEGLRSVDGGSSALPFVLQCSSVGPMTMVSHMGSGRAKEESKVIHGCRCCTHSANIRRSVLSSPTSAQESLSSRSMMTSTLCHSLSEMATSTICCGTNCGTTVEFKSTVARHKSGTVADSSHLATLHCFEVARMADPEAKLWFGDLED